jgi:hypothetical protein
MTTQTAAAEAGGASSAPAALTIASLPHALLARVLAHLPVDARLRASEVCRGWRQLLATERSLWTALDLSTVRGVAHGKKDALLRAAASKAGGALQSLDVSNSYGLSFGALLDVVTASAQSLRVLCVASSFHGDGWSVERAETLLRAAPRLRQLAADVEDDAGNATRALHAEGVLQPLRIRQLRVYARWADDGAAIRALSAALAARASPLACLNVVRAPLAAPELLDAVVDAALGNKLATCDFTACRLSPVSVPSLVRLLGGVALTGLHIDGDAVQLLDVPAAARMGDALRTNGVLERLTLSNMGLWRDPAAATTLLTSLVAHPSLRVLDFYWADTAGLGQAHVERAGAALSALVAANAPALEELNVTGWHLSDAGLRPLVQALPRNTHLRVLWCRANYMSEAFARDEVLPALRANTSLRMLFTGYNQTWESMREVEDILARRAAEDAA